MTTEKIRRNEIAEIIRSHSHTIKESIRDLRNEKLADDQLVDELSKKLDEVLSLSYMLRQGGKYQSEPVAPPKHVIDRKKAQTAMHGISGWADELTQGGQANIDKIAKLRSWKKKFTEHDVKVHLAELNLESLEHSVWADGNMTLDVPTNDAVIKLRMLKQLKKHFKAKRLTICTVKHLEEDGRPEYEAIRIELSWNTYKTYEHQEG